MQFSDAQLGALEAQGTTLVTAAAGAGKTLVLTHKIAREIKNGTRPDRILALTFTNKAADEMGERLARPELLGRPIERGTANSPWIGTIHSAFYRILREDLPVIDPRYSPRIIPLDDYKAKRMAEEILKEFGYREDDAEWQPMLLLRAIDVAQSDGYWYESSKEYFFYEESNMLHHLAHRFWGRYMEKKRQGDRGGAKFVDFSDMITLTVKLFEEFPAIAEKWRSRYDWVLVDEFQDTNRMQARAIWILAEEHKNLFCAGDIRQSIYGFQGAVPELSINFEQHFSGGKTLYLNTNYRSGSGIVDRGNQLIQHADFKVPDCESTRDGGVVLNLGHFETDVDEAAMVVAMIKGHLKQTGKTPNDFAILYRTNAQSLPFEDEFIKAAIPYVIKGSAGFYGREEVKDLIAFLQMIYDMTDGADDTTTRKAVNILLAGKYGFETEYGAWERMMNRPNRYLGKAFLSQWARYVMRRTSPLDALERPYAKTYMERNADEFAYKLNSIARRFEEDDNLGNLIHDIRTTFDYDKWVAKNFPDIEDNPKWDNMEMLKARAAEFPSLKALLTYAAAAAKPENGDGGQAIKLMTVHSAKGLEFPVVFVVGMAQGVLPHFKALQLNNVEEERRVAYVAVTRAIETAYLSSMAVRMGKPGHVPSQFIEELGLKSTMDEDEYPDPENVVDMVFNIKTQ